MAFKDTPIKRKLTTLFLLTSGVAVTGRAASPVVRSAHT